MTRSLFWLMFFSLFFMVLVMLGSQAGEGFMKVFFTGLFGAVLFFFMCKQINGR